MQRRLIYDSLDTRSNSSENASKNKHMNISICKSLKCFSEHSAMLEFSYDEDALNVIRSLKDRYWHQDKKQWEISANDIDRLMKMLPNYDFNVVGKIPDKKSVSKTSNVTDFEFKTKPFEHQIEGFNYGLEHDRWLLGDEQGLGKTKQVIDIAVAMKLKRHYKHCLIICGVNGLKWNWRNEVEIHSNENALILGQKITKNGKIKIGSSKDKLADVLKMNKNDDLPYFIITNIESFRDKDIAQKVSDLCKKGVIGLVAVDEIHKCKNPSSQQGKGLLKIQSECRIAMTGTPLMNTPLDLFIILKWLGHENHPFNAFKQHFCILGGYGGYEIVGYRNLDELQENLNAIMLRRLKSDVLDLPDKLYIDEYVEMTGKQEIVYKEVSSAIKSNIDKIKGAINPLAELIRLRQATGFTGILSSTIQESAKLDRLIELTEESIENGHKVVIFSNWTQITNVVAMKLHKYLPQLITGETNDLDRQHYVKRFQVNDEVKVIIGTIGAMGTGLTLTAGTVVIFMDEPWTMAAKLQAEDRCHRIGATENITIYTLMCHDTIDERIHELVLGKGAMSDMLVDGKIGQNREALVDFLLS